MRRILRVRGLFLLLITGIFFAQGAYIDTWVLEETECDGVNLVEICYDISGDSALSYLSAAISDSMEFFDPGDGFFSSLTIAPSDTGTGTPPGLHCIEWAFSEDMPDYEGNFDFNFRIHEDGCCLGDSILANGSLPELLFCGDWGYEDTYELNPREDYIEGDEMAERIWQRHPMVADTTLGGTDLTGFIEFGDAFGWGSFSHCYAHFYLCSQDVDTTVYLWTRKDDDIIVWQDGDRIFEEHDHSPNLLASEGPPDMIPIELDACEWHSIYIWIFNRFDTYALAHRLVDISGEPVRSLRYTLDPLRSASWYDSSMVRTFLDSHEPRVEIDCIFEPVPVGEAFTIEWSIEDASPIMETCSIFIRGCGIDEIHATTDYSLDFMPTVECPECTVIVAARDSFCNIGADTCVFWFYEEDDPELIPSIDSVWFAEETDCDGQNLVEICYILSEDSADVRAAISPDSGSTWIEDGDSGFASIEDADGNLGMNIPIGEHCFIWNLSADMPNVEIDSFLIRIATGASVPMVDSFSTLDSTLYTINGNDGYVDSDSGYFVLTRDRNWRNGRLISVDSVYTDTLQVSFRLKLDTDGSSGADGVSLILSRYPDPPLAWGGQLGISQNGGWGIGLDTWGNCCDIDGNHIELSYDDTCCLAGSQPIPTAIEQVPLAEELVDGEWHHIFLDIAYPRIHVRFDGFSLIDGTFPELEPFWAYVGFSASTGSAHSSHIIDDFAIFSPHTTLLNIFETANNTIDSRPPRVEVFSEEDMAIGGDSLSLEWNIEDENPFSDDDYSLFVDYCGLIDTFATSDTSFRFAVMPNFCDSILITVAARDSFCNIGEETIFLPVINFDYAAEPLMPLPNQVTACTGQEIHILMTEPEMINWQVLELHVMGEIYTIIDDELIHRGDTLIFTPPVDYDDNSEIAVALYQVFPYIGPSETIQLLDYSFRTDFTGPRITLQNPEPYSAIREQSPDISIFIEDDITPVYLDDTEICIYGDNCYGPASFAATYDGNTARIDISLKDLDIFIADGDSADIRISRVADSPDLCAPNISDSLWFFYVETKICDVFPNPFTPNSDGYNDNLHFIYPGMEIDAAEVVIFNTRKQELFRQTLPPTFGQYNTSRIFDGISNKNNRFKPGLYFYIIEKSGEVICKGSFVLIR